MKLADLHALCLANNANYRIRWFNTIQEYSVEIWNDDYNYYLSGFNSEPLEDVIEKCVAKASRLTQRAADGGTVPPNEHNPGE